MVGNEKVCADKAEGLKAIPKSNIPASREAPNSKQGRFMSRVRLNLQSHIPLLSPAKRDMKMTRVGLEGVYQFSRGRGRAPKPPGEWQTITEPGPPGSFPKAP